MSFQNIFINSLDKSIDKISYNNSQSEFIFMKENFCLLNNNMHYDIFTDDDYLQLPLMILIAKGKVIENK